MVTGESFSGHRGVSIGSLGGQFWSSGGVDHIHDSPNKIKLDQEQTKTVLRGVQELSLAQRLRQHTAQHKKTLRNTYNHNRDQSHAYRHHWHHCHHHNHHHEHHHHKAVDASSQKIMCVSSRFLSSFILFFK